MRSFACICKHVWLCRKVWFNRKYYEKVNTDERKELIKWEQRIERKDRLIKWE